MVFRHLKNTVFSKGLNSPQNALVAAIHGAEADMIRFRSGYFRILFDILSISPIFAPPKKALLQ
jgi:mRNA-degrading endonuclease RelE of RelBE toxin-antitoxin system